MVNMLKKTDYKNVYKKSTKTGNYMIPVALDTYNEVFNEWDFSSFKRRDVNNELAYFLEDCSEDIPLKCGVDIVFYAPKDIKDNEKENLIRSGIKTYYCFNLSQQIKELNEIYYQSFTFVIVSLSFLSLAFVFDGLSTKGLLANLLLEGFFIGGWIFLWEAVNSFMFYRRKRIKLKKMYSRLADAKISFRYKSKKAMAS